MVATTHTATQLVQLGQTELVGAADQNRVGRRNIDTGFDDGRAQQNVVALGHKVAHDFFQLALGHLAVGHGNAGLGQDFFELLLAVFDGLDFVVQKVDLTTALQFTQNRFANHARAFVAHKGFDSKTSLRGGGYDR